MERYVRQISLAEIGEEGQRRLSEAKVLIVGAGGLGSPAAMYLTAAGVGHIGLMDDDTVGLSNLQRQILYAEAELGKFKAEAAAERLMSMNTSIRAEPIVCRLSEENAEGVIGRFVQRGLQSLQHKLYSSPYPLCFAAQRRYECTLWRWTC